MSSADLWRLPPPDGGPTPFPELTPQPHHPVVLRVSDRRRVPFRRQGQTPPASTSLTARVEALLEGDGEHQRHLRVVRNKQRALRGRVDRVGWRAYLELEEAEFQRWSHAIDRVARWALERGRRSRR